MQGNSLYLSQYHFKIIWKWVLRVMLSSNSWCKNLHAPCYNCTEWHFLGFLPHYFLATWTEVFSALLQFNWRFSLVVKAWWSEQKMQDSRAKADHVAKNLPPTQLSPSLHKTKKVWKMTRSRPNSSTWHSVVCWCEWCVLMLNVPSLYLLSTLCCVSCIGKMIELVNAYIHRTTLPPIFLLCA